MFAISLPIRRIVLCAALCLLAGCGAAGSRASGTSLDSELQNLRWDIGVVEDDLFVTRLAVGEQRRRVKQTVADLRAARSAPADLLDYQLGLISKDAGHADDGLRQVKRNAARVELSLAFVARDLARLANADPPRRDAARITDALAYGRRELRRLSAAAAASLAEATRLRDLIEAYARQAAVVRPPRRP
jgi:hypothetical protein